LARHHRAPPVEVVLHQEAAPVFVRHDLEEQIAGTLEPVVELPSGGSLVIGTTEALTAIDVNTARQAGAGRVEDTLLAVNLEAAAEIARQVRLRNLAGLIVIDFVHMEHPAHRARVLDALRAAFAGDPLPVQLGGWTSFGLVEMTRKRVRDSLRDTLTELCETCHGSGRIRSAATVAYELLRAAAFAAAATPGRPLTALAAAAVVAALDGEAKLARLELEARLGRPLVLRAEPARGREQFDIVTG
jgi:ribonuclease G